MAILTTSDAGDFQIYQCTEIYETKLRKVETGHDKISAYDNPK